jgi:hypothetical protein
MNTPAQSITLADFQTLCAQIWEEKGKLERIEAEAKNQSQIVESLKSKVIACMDEYDMDKFAVAGHGTLFKQNRFTVTVPKDGSEREAFFGHLRQRGIFDELITVNSQTLNSWYKREMEAALEQGNPDFTVPGIAEPKLVTTLGMRKG